MRERRGRRRYRCFDTLLGFGFRNGPNPCEAMILTRTTVLLGTIRGAGGYS